MRFCRPTSKQWILKIDIKPSQYNKQNMVMTKDKKLKVDASPQKQGKRSTHGFKMPKVGASPRKWRKTAKTSVLVSNPAEEMLKHMQEEAALARGEIASPITACSSLQ